MTTCTARTLGMVGLPLVLLASAGCATTHGRDMSAQELHGRVLHLENLAEQRDQELAQLREELTAEREARQTLEQRVGGNAGAAAARPAAGGLTIREVQQALQRAGFDPGAIDGRMGRKTREALRHFQQAQGLTVDGRIGPQTIAKLKTYMTPATSGEQK